MTSYFRPDIKGDAARKEMVLSQCTGPFFFFEQKVSFQMLTKVRCHLILKGRCVETSEAPNSVPESHYSIPFRLVSSFQIPQPPPPNILIHFFFASFLHLFNGHLLSSGSERSVGLKSSKTQILSRGKRTRNSSISLKDFFH